MKILIKSALILDPRSFHNGKKLDILIEKGKITAIGSNFFESRAKVIREEGLCISPGWTDLRANFCDPGNEHLEDLQSGICAALKGGFSTVVVMPSTTPPADNGKAIEYILSKTKGAPVHILPAGTLSEKMKGIELSEMLNMHSAGAICFTDDKSPVKTELMAQALDLGKTFDALIYSFPLDKIVNSGGLEGTASAKTGIKGRSVQSEERLLVRDISLLRHSKGRLHISLVSTAEEVEIIRAAKKEGLHISCSIAAHQLSFTEHDLPGLDPQLKVLPSFPTDEDHNALIEGLRDGTIDAICSDHSPQDTEHKFCESESSGISGIETAFCAAYTSLEKHLPLETIVAGFSWGPAALLGLDKPVIEEGNRADITLFSTKLDTTFSKENRASRSLNSPFIGSTLRGRIIPL
ncbi:MAG: dihydroorotase [Crocinitomicaceae bacterium]|nr:dihydroorotase [Crocinitomicaceae bacterium]